MDLSFPLPDQDTQQRLVDTLATAHIDASTKRTEAATLRKSAWTAFESALFTATGEAAA
jgi:type I restriction enzyme S subunit